MKMMREFRWWFVMGGLVTFLGFAASDLEAETLKTDWSSFALGETPSGISGHGIPMFAQDLGTSRVVDATSTPPNPFSETPNALYIGRPNELAQFRLRFRPFYDELVTKGWIEFEFQMIEGDFFMGFGGTATRWDETDDWAYIDTKRVASIRFKIGDPIMFRNDPLRTPEATLLEPERTYRLRVSWNLESEVPQLRFLIDGEKVLAEDGEELVVSADDLKLLSEEYLAFGFYSGSSEVPNAEMFLGRISASSEDSNQ